MKIFKKCAMGLSAVAVTLSLSACGNSSGNENEGEYGVSNVLNSKEMLPVVVTDSENEGDKDHLVWAGFIGQGKIKAMHLDGMVYDFGYKDLKKLNNKKFNSSLIDMGKDYEPTESKYVTAKAETILKTNWKSTDNDEDKTEAVGMKFLKSGDGASYSGVKDSINNAVFSNVSEKENDDEWATIKSGETDTDYSGYEMHIKLGKGKKANLKLDDPKKAEKDYDNVKIDDEDYTMN